MADAAESGFVRKGVGGKMNKIRIEEIVDIDNRCL